jgi:SAM-dependent methyltransferase
MSKSWADHYREYCGNDGLLGGNIMRHARFVEELARWVKVGSRVLEVGSGTGVIGWPLAQAGVKVVSLDNDQEILEMAKLNAKTLGASIEYVFGDALHLGYADGEFDLVYSHGLLEHFGDEELEKAIYEHRRVGKMVVVGMPLVGCRDGAFGNERWRTLDEWTGILDKAGLIKRFAYAEEGMGCFTLYGLSRADIFEGAKLWR